MFISFYVDVLRCKVTGRLSNLRNEFLFFISGMLAINLGHPFPCLLVEM